MKLSPIRALAAASAMASVAIGVSGCTGGSRAAADTARSSGNPTAMMPDSTATHMDSAGGLVDTSSSSAPVAAVSSVPAPWTDPAILGYAVAANSNEVQLGRLGEKKATSTAVKAFARQMVADHGMMLNNVKSLATKLDLAPDTIVDVAHGLMVQGRDEETMLADKPAGSDWDTAYIDAMIRDHQAVLAKLQDAQQGTMTAQLKTALGHAITKVQEHLKKAQDIKAKG